MTWLAASPHGVKAHVAVKLAQPQLPSSAVEATAPEQSGAQLLLPPLLGGQDRSQHRSKETWGGGTDSTYT